MRKKILCIPLVILLFIGLNANTVKLHIIDIMQGDAILIQYEGDNYLIDSGKNRSDNKLLTYLQQNGVETIQACLLTHPDYDHLGEFEDLIESELFQVDKFIKNQDTATTVSYLSLMDYLDTYEIPIQIVDYQSDLNWSIQTDVLSPNYENGFNDANDNSIVIKIILGEISILLMGDSEEDNNNYLLNYYNLDIDILKVSHHGAVNGTNQAFIDEATPAISILSSGNNGYGHPAISVTQMLLAAGSFVFSTADDYLTHTNGSDDVTVDDDIVVETDGSSVWVNDDLVIDGVSNEDLIIPDHEIEITNYPNPFNPETLINYQLSEVCRISLSIYNTKGQLINSLVDGIEQSGEHSVVWSGNDDNKEPVGSGIYFAKIKANTKESVKRMILLK